VAGQRSLHLQVAGSTVVYVEQYELEDIVLKGEILILLLSELDWLINQKLAKCKMLLDTVTPWKSNV
jgi:hypothetical protein